MNKRLLVCLVFLMVIGSLTAAGIKPAKGGKNKPNVILIFADDISARELPIYGSTVWSDKKGNNTNDPALLAKTPTLDRIANKGLWVTDAWAATVCSPSRAMMMTGRYASIHKWWHNEDYGRVPDGTKKGRIINIYESSPLQIGHVAQQAGYATMWAGKTQMKHCDHQRFGFDEGAFTPGSYRFPKNPHTDFKLVRKWVDGKRILINLDTGKTVKGYAQDGWYWKPCVALMNHPDASEEVMNQPDPLRGIEWWPNNEEAKKNYGLNTYGPDVVLDFIFDFIDRKHTEGKPFFIYHTSHLGHDAFDWFHPESGNKWPGTPIINWDGKKYTRTDPHITGDNGVYNTHGTVSEPGMHSHVKYLDYHVWRYLKKLKSMGIENDTILIFTADNGTSGYGKASHDRQKGTHVPFIVYAPGEKFTKSGKQQALVNMSDILPTLVEIMGTTLPTDYEIHGESLWPFLTTSKAGHRDWIYAYKSDKQMIRGHKVLRDGYGKWWDVENTPADLISFKQIKDWGQVSEAHRDERDKLNSILPRFDNYHTEHDLSIK